ncbi:hypothetical protein MMU07_01955 [Aquiflexum sp. LQ15W]|uniref:hypothetical protein n=1 Tax=Cognataquiflexum nitidum TaxID=2922272 RepID=UPI001F133161|nr:hypothetical protein [Cognataquiflexum nitidum]MCH6198328.1 hypothetical protein [Cognataquiflexum nitidum]
MNIFIPLVIAISMFANTLFFVDTPWFLVLAFLFLGYKHFEQKFGNSRVLIAFLLSWAIINLVAFVYHRTGFSVITFFGYAIRMSIAFFLVHAWKSQFWNKFESLIFIMTIVSLGFYCLNLIFPHLFNQIHVIFQPFTNNVYLQKDAQLYYWNNFFYTHSGRNDLRNSGFMWEPGAFAMSSVLMIVYNWTKGGIKYSKRFWVYSLAIVTTLSTAGYISLMLLIFSNSLKRLQGIIFIFLAITLVLLNPQVLYNDFLIPKIEQFIKEAEEDTVYSQEFSDRFEANRIAYFGINFLKSMDYPFGHGVIEDRSSSASSLKIVGVGGLAEVLYKWGFVGLIGFLWVIFKLLIIYLPISTKKIQHISIFGAIIIPLFSNPIENTLIGFMILFSFYLPNRHFK